MIKIGDYVLVSRWSDEDMHDPWRIGILERIIIDKFGKHYFVEGVGRYYKWCRKITPEEAAERIEWAKQYNDHEE